MNRPTASWHGVFLTLEDRSPRGTRCSLDGEGKFANIVRSASREGDVSWRFSSSARLTSPDSRRFRFGSACYSAGAMTLRRGSLEAAVLTTAIAWLAAIAPGDARANGRLPATKELVISPTDPSLFAVEATFGLLVSRNAGASFGWVCEPALGYPSTAVEDPSIGITPTTLLAGIVQGVAVSTDQGCSWQFTLTEPISDIVVRRDDPHSALALSSHYLGLTDAGRNAFVTAVYATHDDGATWVQGRHPRPVRPPRRNHRRCPERRESRVHRGRPHDARRRRLPDG